MGLPAIVVEVLSPSTRSIDLLRKRGDYERLGVAEQWVFDPVDASALVMRRDGDRYADIALEPGDVLTSPLLPGFSVTVGALFVR
jgi:Uma2 family endonuclease